MGTPRYTSNQRLKETFIRSDLETIFYCGAELELVKSIANSKGKRTYVECWPEEILDPRPGKRGYRRFARRFSEILAQEAAGIAWVVMPPLPGKTSKWSEPSNLSVWVVNEHPTLGSNDRVTRLVWINSQTRAERVVWTKISVFVLPSSMHLLAFCSLAYCLDGLITLNQNDNNDEEPVSTPV